MKITFGLGWAENSAKSYLKNFKETLAGDLFDKYVKRMQHDFSIHVRAMPFDSLKQQTGAVWICEREKRSKTLSSEALANQFQRVCGSGSKSLTIWIGGPDGVLQEDLAMIRPELIWSFGPMTLPHELAAVVASEQLYRAISIIKNHPYHLGH